MKVETRLTLAMDAVSEYVDHFRDRDQVKCDLLLALGDDPDPDKVDEIIGHPWTTVCACDECCGLGGGVVMVGQKPDDESHTAWICLDCLKRAVSLLEGQVRKEERIGRKPG